MNPNQEALLRIRGLSVDFDASGPGELRALREISLSIETGEIVGLVGESGSGKTVLSLSILGLLPSNARISAGQILWKGRDLHGLREAEYRSIRGKEIAMIFQDPQASLNPIHPVGHQIQWILKHHRAITGPAAKAEVIRLFESVQLRDPERCYHSYPHELSGGMCQRVMIAMALAGQPKLLIADEPTSALDVSVAAGIVSLLANLREELDLSILIITHDLGVATCLADRIAVLDQGCLVEDRSASNFLSRAEHDASQSLIQASRFLGAALHGAAADRQATEQKLASLV